MLLLLAQIGDFHLVAGAVHGHNFLELSEFVDLLIIDGGNDVTLLETGCIGCAVCSDFSHVEAGQRTEINVFALVFLFVDVVGHRSTADSQQCTLNDAEFAQVFHHFVHNCGRNRETVAAVGARFRIDHRVDSDQFARSIHQRTAGVARIDGSIGLNEAFNRIGRLHGTRFGTDDSGRNSGGETVRIADGQNPLADFELFAATHSDGLEVFGFDLDQSEIRVLVLSDDAAFILAIVVEFDQNLVSVFHNMVVGHDISVGSQDHARTCAAALGGLSRLLLARCALAEEVAEEVFEGIEILHIFLRGSGGNFYVDD